MNFENVALTMVIHGKTHECLIYVYYDIGSICNQKNLKI
jgi:hypothetical protein